MDITAWQAVEAIAEVAYDEQKSEAIIDKEDVIAELKSELDKPLEINLL